VDAPLELKAQAVGLAQALRGYNLVKPPSIDEIVQHLIDLIHQMKATRVVIDSLSGFELAVAPTFREDFRESLYRLVTVLSGVGVTVQLKSS